MNFGGHTTHEEYFQLKRKTRKRETMVSLLKIVSFTRGRTQEVVK